MKVTVDSSDLEKIQDILIAAVSYHERKDEMNAATHLAENVRYSPLTSRLQAEEQRIAVILDEAYQERE